MTIKQLTYFLTVAKYESFTKASEKLYVSQSALSKAIKTFEFELGITLIDRTSKKFKLTSEGRILFLNGNIALNSINKKLEQLKDSISDDSGEITIGVPPVISTIYFTFIVYKFQKLYPNIKLNIIEQGANNIKCIVNKGDIDIGVIILPFENNIDYNIYPVFIADCCLVVSKKHRLFKEKEVNLSDLKDENFIILNDSYMLYNRIHKLCNVAGFVPNITSTSSQWDYIVEMVSLNQGVTILPRLIVEKYHSKNIKLLTIKNPVFPWDIALIIRKNKYISKPLKIFIEFCKKEGEKYFNKL